MTWARARKYFPRKASSNFGKQHSVFSRGKYFEPRTCERVIVGTSSTPHVTYPDLFSAPTFVYSFETDDYVYFVYQEIAVEISPEVRSFCSLFLPR